MIVIHTNRSNITLELFADKAPETVKNFLNYVEQGFYKNTIFHRVISGFMIQGGGLSEDMHTKDTQSPIKNEANNGVQNKTGTIAMARTSDPHSATAQFFINVANNHFLDFTSESIEGWGYCAFGEVTEGMDVVEKIAKLKTTSKAGHDDVPIDAVIIEKIEQV